MALTFDALDRMVEQNRSGSYTQIVYGPGGGKLALMNGQSLNKAFVPLSGGATAVYNASGLAYYRHSDWLGSSRIASLATGSSRLSYDGAYAPYGENYAESGTQDRNFTGMNQDTISTGPYPLYDGLYREYHPTWGRWLNPDPAGLAAASPANPQSLNRYAYALNNPTTLTDPKGLCPQGGNTNGSPYCYGSGLGIVLMEEFNLGGGTNWSANVCNVDGMGIPCNWASILVQSGAAVQCPSNACTGVNGSGQIVQFKAFADGTSGYYLPGQAPQQNTLALELQWMEQLVHDNNSSGLPDSTAVCTAWKESGFNVLAHNTAGGGFGAIGLFQVRSIGLTDFNQTWLGKGNSPYTQRDLWDPTLNTYIGTAEIYNQVFRYNGGNIANGLNNYGTGSGYSNSILACSQNLLLQGTGALK